MERHKIKREKNLIERIYFQENKSYNLLWKKNLNLTGKFSLFKYVCIWLFSFDFFPMPFYPITSGDIFSLHFYGIPLVIFEKIWNYEEEKNDWNFFRKTLCYYIIFRNLLSHHSTGIWYLFISQKTGVPNDWLIRVCRWAWSRLSSTTTSATPPSYTVSGNTSILKYSSA